MQRYLRSRRALDKVSVQLIIRIKNTLKRKTKQIAVWRVQKHKSYDTSQNWDTDLSVKSLQ